MANNELPEFDETAPTNLAGKTSEPQSPQPEPVQFDATVPVVVQVESVQPELAPHAATTPPPNKKGFPWKRATLLGILAIIVIAILSGVTGYVSGISRRKDAEKMQIVSVASEQFALAQEDIASGQFPRARQRLEYIAQIAPEYPGLTELLSQVLVKINATSTPTPIPTVEITPVATQDGGGAEAYYNQAQQYFLNNDWDNTIDTLLIARKTDPNYRPVEIDGMMFIALRNRGIDKVIKRADLEGGLYDLTLASRFGPLDSEADGYFSWVSLYITGASFWELDWEQAVNYFSQVAPAFPGLTDRSGWTARERYRLALKNYGLELLEAGDCEGAYAQFELSLAIGPDPEVEQAMSDALERCAAGEEEPPPVVEEPTLEPTPGLPPIEITPEPQETPPVYPPPVNP